MLQHILKAKSHQPRSRNMSEPFERTIYNGQVFLKRDRNHRYKVQKAGDAKPVAVPSVTTIINMKAKPILIPWAAGKAADKFEELAHSRAERYPSIMTNPRTSEDAPIAPLFLEDIYAWAELIRKAHSAKSEGAADIGTAVHQWAEISFLTLAQGGKFQDLKAPTGDWATEEATNACRELISWIRRNNVKAGGDGIERPVYSLARHYTGCADLLLKVNGRDGLWDMKTGKSVYPEVMMQTAAYARALTEETRHVSGGPVAVDNLDRGVLLFVRDKDGNLNGDLEVVHLAEDMTADLRAFDALHEIYRWNRGAWAELMKAHNA